MEQASKFMGRRPRILVCDPIAESGIDLLQDHTDVDVVTHLSAEDLLEIIPRYDALVVGGTTRVTAQVIDYGLKLKLIGRAGSSLDNIDVLAARARGIEVVNSPHANTVAVAEHTLGLLLSAARRLPRADMNLKRGKWERTGLVGTGLAGKTLGIVGFGRIGREVAIRARAFGMRVLVNQKRPTPELNLQAGVENVDLNDLLRQSDFVTLHVPLREETRHLIGREQLAQMKPTAHLINTARGGVIDEQALLEALDTGQIAGAALDVFAEEPVTTPRLIQHERVIATPYIAASTEDARQQAAVAIAEQVIDFFEETEVESVLPLRVVPMDRVFPHENIDRRRVARLAARLAQDGQLVNPPIVTEVDGRYMVLDGATRTAALKQLKLPHAIVQLISSKEGLGLHTWFHVIRQIEPDLLLAMLQALPFVNLVETDPEKAEETMFEYGGLCYLHTIQGQVFMTYAAPGVNRLEALNQLTETYIEASHVSRTLDDNVISLQHEYPDMTAVVIFPTYTVDQVIQATTSSGRLFPAGITRFIIPGRVLRLNVDLSFLQSDQSLREKNRGLHELLLERQAKGGIRYYAEPVFLLDE